MRTSRHARAAFHGVLVRYYVVRTLRDIRNLSTRLYSLLRLLPFLALVVSSLPLLSLKVPEGHDWLYELVRVSEFKTAVINGHFPLLG